MWLYCGDVTLSNFWGPSHTSHTGKSPVSRNGKKIPAPFTLAKELRWLNSHVQHMALDYFMCHYDGHKVEEGVGDRE